jgi:hypothetical protein
MRTLVTSPVYTWRVTTPSGVVEFAVNVHVQAAIRRAGMAGPESVTPATAEEHALGLAWERAGAAGVFQPSVR